MDATLPTPDQMDPTAPFLKDPRNYPHTLDAVGDGVGFAPMTREALRAASFLDERALPDGVPLQWRPWQEVAGTAREAGLTERCGFIFHIGHVGSTLLSRLLETDARLLCLREPLPLRVLAGAHEALGAPGEPWSQERFDERLEVMLKLWSRSFEPGQLTVVKASSFCSGLAETLLGREASPRAILMYAPPEAFLANLLAGENNHLDIQANAPGRISRLDRRLGAPAFRLGELSYPETAAMSWACEMVELKAAADARPGQAMWLDFERFLARPQSLLRSAFAHLGVETDEARIAGIVAGPDMSRYSKAPEHAYDATLRARVLAQARARHGGAIAEGLAWLERAGRDHPAIAGALAVAVWP
jgi:hypothetical protein